MTQQMVDFYEHVRYEEQMELKRLLKDGGLYIEQSEEEEEDI